MRCFVVGSLALEVLYWVKYLLVSLRLKLLDIVGLLRQIVSAAYDRGPDWVALSGQLQPLRRI